MKPSRKTRADQGWARPGSIRNLHYFVNGVSLCGAWKLSHAIDLDPDPGYEDGLCNGCMRARGFADGGGYGAHTFARHFHFSGKAPYKRGP